LSRYPRRPFGQFPFQAVARRVQTQYFRRIFGNMAARRDRRDGGVIDVWQHNGLETDTVVTAESRGRRLRDRLGTASEPVNAAIEA
jgi:hypothetical protein